MKEYQPGQLVRVNNKCETISVRGKIGKYVRQDHDRGWHRVQLLGENFLRPFMDRSLEPAHDPEWLQSDQEGD